MLKIVSLLVALLPVSAFAQQAVYDLALKEVGHYKMPGTNDSRVRQYSEETSNPIEFYTDDGWCSAFAAWVLKNTGYQYANYPTGEEWMHVADVIDDPVPGNICLMQSHIAFFGGWLDLPGYGKAVLLLGGNQAHRVCVLPVGEANILYFMAPRKAPEGWNPRHHFAESIATSTNKLDDKSGIMSILEYQMRKDWGRYQNGPTF
jgi:uncharacterized protein (TIGR02594 family)